MTDTKPNSDVRTTGTGFYQYNIGDITVTAAWDGYNAMPLKEGFVRNATLAEVQDTLDGQFLPRDTLNITFTPLALQLKGETVLIDTGFGNAGPGTAGRMRANLSGAGITPESVTKIIFSHFHGDHINGLRNADGALAFPNAELMVPAAEWNFWMDEGRFAQAADAQKKPFELVRKIFAGLDDRLTHYQWETEVAPGITALDAKGHTPGHTAFTISSGIDSLLMISDVTNHPALFMTHPDWAPTFDMDPEEAKRTRHRILDMAASDKLRISGYHLPFPATGHVEKTESGFRFVPAQWLYGV